MVNGVPRGAEKQKKTINQTDKTSQRAHISCQRQHNRTVAVLTGSGSWSGTDSDADRHQNVISWSLRHTPALYKISSKSVGNFFDNSVNADFGLRTPGSGRWSGFVTKIELIGPGPCPTPPRNFVKIRSQLFSVIWRTDRQTNRQTDKQTEVKT